MLGQSTNAIAKEFSSYGSSQKIPSNLRCSLEFGQEDSQKFWILKKENTDEKSLLNFLFLLIIK